MNIIHFIGENGAIYWVNPIYQPDITETELLSDKIDIDKIGILHRDDGPAVEYPNGTKHWYQNGELHRTDGPAIEFPDGAKCWCINGQYHRIDGPAVEYFIGIKHWYVRDTNITEWIKENGISDNPTQEEQLFIALNWA